GLDRLLPVLEARLTEAGRGARRLRFSITRSDHTSQVLEIGLASPTRDPARMRPLIALKIGQFDAGYGIDRLRLQAHVTEPLYEIQHKGHADAVAAAERLKTHSEDTAMHALIDRIGARLGMDALTRLHPAESHIPEKSGIVMAAAFSTPATAWPDRAVRRPPRLFNPEPLTLEPGEARPRKFRWRRRAFTAATLSGPERIAPEWWLDDPAWRSGVRDYWRVETTDGTRLWVFQTRSEQGGGWFVHGDFC
ncbi:MAG: DNA polymerase Y family protein, partial [Pseudomonadota bacterium]